MSLSFKNDGSCSTQYNVKPCYKERKYFWPRNVLFIDKIPRITFEKVGRGRFHRVENINPGPYPISTKNDLKLLWWPCVSPFVFLICIRSSYTLLFLCAFLRYYKRIQVVQ